LNDPRSRATDDAVAEEDRRARQLRLVVDLTCNVIAQGGLGPGEAQELVDAARRRVLELFPGKEDTFDLILAPRFARLIREFAREPARPKVLPFRPF
jgi:hypothetical protein